MKLGETGHVSSPRPITAQYFYLGSGTTSVLEPAEIERMLSQPDISPELEAALGEQNGELEDLPPRKPLTLSEGLTAVASGIWSGVFAPASRNCRLCRHALLCRAER